MEQLDIAPLARRLAEENNVDWRRLRGSGDRGRVVERDVLEFLARVMAGEEDVDPTPEPLPDGMQAWPDDDVRAYERERRGEHAPPPEGHATLDDEIFLLEGDDEDRVGEGYGANGGVALDDASDDLLDTGVDVADDLSEDDLLIAGDDEPAAAPPHSWRDAADLDAPSTTADDGGGGDETYADDDVVVGSGGRPQGLLPDLFDDDGADADGSLSPVFEDAGLGEPTGPAAAFAAGPSLEDDVYAHGGSAPSWRTATPDVSLDDDGEAQDRASGAPTPHVPAVSPDDDREAPASASAAPTPPVPAVSPPPAEVPGVAALPQAETDEGRLPTATAAEDLPLVHHGSVWRRQVDLTGLVAAQSDVARDLGLDRPVPAAAFLVRAALKAAPAGASVAVALIGEGGTRSVRVDPELRFSELALRMLADPLDEGSAETPDLIVADLSELEVDEAVLHLGAPVLCLGRVLIDSSTGGRRAMLSLSGDGTSASTSRILARAADLLETPIRLVL